MSAEKQENFKTSPNLRKRKTKKLYPDIDGVLQQDNFEGAESYSFHEDVENLGHSAANHESDNDDEEKGKKALHGSLDELRRSKLKRKSESDHNYSSNSECDSSFVSPSDSFKDTIDTNTTKEHLFSSPKPIFILLLIIGVLTFILLSFLLKSGGGKIETKENYVHYLTEFIQDLNKIQRHYKMQHKKMWTLIKASIKSVLTNVNSIQPSVLLFLSSVKGRPTSRSLAKSIAMATGRAFTIRRLKTVPKNDDDVIKFKSIECSEMLDFDAGTTKHLINSALAEAFNKNQLNVAVLFDINRLPDSSPLVLHEFCDNVNAPYKNVALILTAVCQEEMINDGKLGEKHWDLIGEDCMRSILAKNGFNEDKIAALLARIANSVAVIIEEEPEIEFEN